MAEDTAPERTEPPEIDLSDVDWSQAVVCYARCWSCQFDCCFDPPQMHTWMDKEDAIHAGHPWPLPPEIAAQEPCACPCAKEAKTDA